MAEPPALAQPLSLTTLVQGLQRCWPTALGVGVVMGLVGAAVAYLFLPGKYVAQAQIHISTMSTTPGMGYESPGNFDHFVKTQAATLTGDSLIKRVASEQAVVSTAEMQAQGDPEMYLSKNLTTDVLLGPELLRVSLSGDHPGDLATVLNTLVATYVKDYRDEEQRKVDERLALLRKNRLTYFQRLNGQHDPTNRNSPEDPNSLRSVFAAAMRDAKLDDPKTVETRFHKALEALSYAEARQRDLTLDLTATKALLGQEQKKLGNVPVPQLTPKMIDDEMANNFTYRLALENLALAEAKYAATTSVAVGSSAAKKELEVVNRTRAELDELRRRSETQVRASLIAKEEALIKANIHRLESEIFAIEQKKEKLAVDISGSLKSDLDSMQAQMKKISQLPPKLESMKDEITGLETVLSRMNMEISTLEIERPNSRITVKQSATPPTAPKLDKFLKYGAVAFLGMFILGVMSVAVVECLRRRVYGANDVSHGLGINLLGTVPNVSEQARKPLPATTPQEYALTAPMTESVDTIRTVLLKSPAHKGVKVVMVTSAVSGEGKTSVACHLAASLARAGKRTVLLDSDLRKPAAHRQFDVPLEPGFSEYLRGDMDFDDIVVPSPVSGLSIIPAGRWDPAASQALSLETVGKCFDDLRQNYDIVIVDVPPVLPLADAMLIGQYADAALFAVMRDVSRVPALWQAYQRLASLGIRMLGAVLIGENSSAYGSYAASINKTPAPTA
jgi:capsular exopolysaccharide synthesis family protein